MIELFRENRLVFKRGETLSEGLSTPPEEEKPEQKALSDYGVLIESPDPETKDKLKSPEQKELSDQPNIPERPKDAITGTQFGAKLKEMETELSINMKKEGKSPKEISNEIRKHREKAIYSEIKKGNIPEHLRKFKPVELKYENNKGETVTAKIKVMPDYIAIGSDKDHVRMPMTPYTAQLLARHWNCTLPTTKMVDAIAKHSKVKVAPIPKPPGSAMMSTDYFLEHNQQIQDQLAKTAYKPGDLVSGIKKDIVLPEQGEGITHVVIYGWHQPNGEKIQPYSHKAHESTYADYSHGAKYVLDYVELEIRDKNKKLVRREVKRATDIMADKYRYFILADKPIQNSQTAYEQSPWAKDISGAEPLPSVPKSAEIPTSQDEGIPIDLSSEPAPYSAKSTPPPTESSQTQYSSYPSYSPPAQTEEVAPPETVTPSTIEAVESRPLKTPLEPIIPASSPKEYLRLNKAPPPIKGKSAFFGDSISFRIDEMPYLKGQGHEDFAKGGKDTKWLGRKVRESSDRLKEFENAFVLIGTNDLGNSYRSAQEIFDNTMNLCRDIKSANRDINLHLCTVPPYGGFKKYDRNPAINEKRHDLNNLIRKEAKENPGQFRLVDLCLPLEQGGISDRGIEDYKNARIHNALKFRNAKHPEREDHLHPYQEILARTMGRAYHAYEANDSGQSATPEKPAEGFNPSPEFSEQTKTYKFPPGSDNAMTVHINKTEIEPNKETSIIVYGLPAGNTIPQTIGSQDAKGDNWRFGIQHIGAQVRQLRAAQPDKNIVIAYVQSPTGTLNKWLRENPNTNITTDLLQSVKAESGTPNATINLSSHSAGGELIDHYIKNNQEIPNHINRITFLDSQNTLDIEQAGPKLITWLKASKDHHLTIIGYDDRASLLNGKPFPGRGSSYASLIKIAEYLADNGLTPPFDNASFQQKQRADTHTSLTGLNGQINIKLLHNPGKGTRIRHTETVEYNGFIVGETAGTPSEIAGFQDKPTYAQYIQKGHTNLA